MYHAGMRLSPLASAFFLLSAGALALGAGCSDDSPADGANDDGTSSSSGGTDASTSRPDASSSSSGGSSGASSSSSSSGAIDPDAGTDAGPAVDFFDPAVVPELRIDLDAEAIAILSDTSADEDARKKWAKGTLHYGNETYEEVGIRRKGSSTFRSYPQKMSLKIRFDKNVDGQRFHGLTDLTLNNMVSDSTQLVERLAYHVFRSLGLPAQRANSAHVALVVNGVTEDFGLYANVETPNQDLIERLYGANAKTLYEAQTGDWSGASSPLEDKFEVESDDDEYTDLPPFVAAFNAAQPETLLADMSTVLDTDSWLTFCAAEAAVKHVDGYAYGYVGSHNYFLAGDTSGKFTMLPWSVDLTFSDNIASALSANDPGRPNYTQDGRLTLLQRCKASSTCWPAYKTAVSTVLGTFEGLDLGALAATWRAQIAPYVNAATFDAQARLGRTNASYVGAFEGENNRLGPWIAARPGIVRTQLGL